MDAVSATYINVECCERGGCGRKGVELDGIRNWQNLQKPFRLHDGGTPTRERRDVPGAEEQRKSDWRSESATSSPTHGIAFSLTPHISLMYLWDFLSWRCYTNIIKISITLNTSNRDPETQIRHAYIILQCVQYRLEMKQRLLPTAGSYCREYS